MCLANLDLFYCADQYLFQGPNQGMLDGLKSWKWSLGKEMERPSS